MLGPSGCGKSTLLRIIAGILPLDKPLCNLDVQLRIEMRTAMSYLFHKLETTAFHVTHDPSEAFAMADRIIVMNGGKIDQADDPRTCFLTPFGEDRFLMLDYAHRSVWEDGDGLRGRMTERIRGYRNEGRRGGPFIMIRKMCSGEDEEHIFLVYRNKKQAENLVILYLALPWEP